MTLKEEVEILNKEYDELPIDEKKRLQDEHSKDDCDNCWFYVNGQCERVGGCRYD